MKPAVVSVLIPTRNRAELLGLAIRSALGQSLSEIEVIVVDDASEDGTAEVVAALRDPRLRLQRQGVRQGAAAARNAGIRRSTGEFVAFLDDDDEWLPEKLERQIDLFRRGGPELGVVYSSYAVVDRATGDVLGRKVAQKRGNLRELLLERNYVGSTSCAVVRRCVFDRVGLWDERLPSLEDYDLWIRLAREFEFDFVDADLLKYFIHGNRTSTNFDAIDRGIDLMLEKHGSSRAFRRNLSGQSLGVGVYYCSRREMEKGRAALRRALRLDPTSPRAFLNAAIAHLGGPVFRGARAIREKMLARGGDAGSLESSVLNEAGR